MNIHWNGITWILSGEENSLPRKFSNNKEHSFARYRWSCFVSFSSKKYGSQRTIQKNNMQKKHSIGWLERRLNSQPFSIASSHWTHHAGSYTKMNTSNIIVADISIPVEVIEVINILWQLPLESMWIRTTKTFFFHCSEWYTDAQAVAEVATIFTDEQAPWVKWLTLAACRPIRPTLINSIEAGTVLLFSWSSHVYFLGASEHFRHAKLYREIFAIEMPRNDYGLIRAAFLLVNSELS